MFTRWADGKNARAEPQLAVPMRQSPAASPSVIAMPPPVPAAVPSTAETATAGSLQMAMQAVAQSPAASPADGSPSSPPPSDDAQPEAGHATHSVIGHDLTIEGQAITIRCRGALEVNGRIQAELHSQRLIVGRSGKIEGTIAAETVDVWGHVSGTILGARVTLHRSAEVEGDIHAKALSVADGASFEGRSRKVTDLAAIAPRLDADSPSVRPAGAEPVPLPPIVQTVVPVVETSAEPTGV